jgi:WXG100 family type VII secretion target
MCADQTQVNYEQLEAITRRLRAEGEAIGEMTLRLRDEVECLCSRDWQGQAAAAFEKEMMGRVLPAMQRLSAALVEAGEKAETIGRIYREHEEEAAGLFKGELGGEGIKNNLRHGGGPKKIVYLINGINYNGSDGDFENLERMIEEQYGSNVDVRIVKEHPYDTNLQRFTLHWEGTKFGGLLSPVDWITDKGAQLGNTAGSGLWNSTNSIIGVGQVIAEYSSGGFSETGRVFKWIAGDLENLKASGLIDQSTDIILFGHSGGGAIGANITDDIKNQLGYNVSALVTGGSPMANYDHAQRYAKNILDIQHQGDGLGQIFGWGSIRSEEMRTAPPKILSSPSKIAAIFYTSQADSMVRDYSPRIRNIFITDGGGNPNLSNPTNWYNAHGSYWNSEQLVNAFGQIL